MPLRADLLTPIAGDNPSGADLRYDNKLLLYDKIREARRQDDDLNQGDWQHERKVGRLFRGHPLTQDALATHTKDLQLAAWLTDALLRTEGFSGLQQGLTFCHALIGTFWETLYPPIEDGDLELRVGPLEWLGAALEIPVKSVPIVRAGYDCSSTKNPSWSATKSRQRTTRTRRRGPRKSPKASWRPKPSTRLLPKLPRRFIFRPKKIWTQCSRLCNRLDELCTAKFGNSAPSFGKLKAATEEVRHTVHQLLQKKREIEPDPVVVAPEPPPAAAAAAPEGAGSEAAAGVPVPVAVAMASAEPADRRDAVDRVAKAAAFLRKREPYSPAPYLMMRGLALGRAAGCRQTRRCHACWRRRPPNCASSSSGSRSPKNGVNCWRWPRMPCRCPAAAPGWTCNGWWWRRCTGLGNEYVPIAAAIRSELKVLLTDLPELLDASLLDDTPAANAETRVWLKQLLQAPLKDAPGPEGTEAPGASNGQPAAASWPAKAADSYASAQEALKSGEAEKAFQIMRNEIARQRSGRGRFQRTLQLVQLCVAAGKDAIAQPLLEDLIELLLKPTSSTIGRRKRWSRLPWLR